MVERNGVDEQYRKQRVARWVLTDFWNQFKALRQQGGTIVIPDISRYQRSALTHYLSGRADLRGQVGPWVPVQLDDRVENGILIYSDIEVKRSKFRRRR